MTAAKREFFIFFVACVAMAHAARMLVQGIVYPGSVYRPGPFDLIFDWATLFILGGILAGSALPRLYHALRQDQTDSCDSAPQAQHK